MHFQVGFKMFLGITAEVRLRLWLQIRLFFCLGAEDIFSHIPSIRNPTLQSHSFLDLTI